MTIEWYPGHMGKAHIQISKLIRTVHVIIEVLDARMPRASENPVLAELRREKPCLKVLGKSDLADPEVTAAWLRWFATVKNEPSREHPEGRVVALALRTDRPQEMRTKIAEVCKRLALHPSGPGKTVRAMVVGIPNVGKSTLINTLMERKVANVGDEPAVTKGRQHVVLKNGMTLSDNPGILWPKIEDDRASYRLALGGAIPDSAIDYESVALFAVRYLREKYPDALRARYKLADLPEAPGALLGEIGKRRGCLRSGGIVDMHKAADILVHDFRAGALGRISLEAPEDA